MLWACLKQTSGGWSWSDRREKLSRRERPPPDCWTACVQGRQTKTQRLPSETGCDVGTHRTRAYQRYQEQPRFTDWVGSRWPLHVCEAGITTDKSSVWDGLTALRFTCTCFSSLKQSLLSDLLCCRFSLEVGAAKRGARGERCRKHQQSVFLPGGRFCSQTEATPSREA